MSISPFFLSVKFEILNAFERGCLATPYHPKNVPEQERQQYMTTFDQVFKISLETEKTAFTYHALLKDDNKTRMIFTHVSGRYRESVIKVLLTELL